MDTGNTFPTARRSGTEKFHASTLCAIVVTLLGITGCGGGSSGSTGETATTTTTTTTTGNESGSTASTEGTTEGSTETTAAIEQPQQPERELSPAPEVKEEIVGARADRVRVAVNPPDGVTYETAPCTRGTAETCNAKDDDCDGRIDNGCGYESGNVQVTIAWGTGADLDLVVENPLGEVISWRAEQSWTGTMDHRTERCDGTRPDGVATIPRARMATAQRIENVFFNIPSWTRDARLARGRYGLNIRMSDACNVPSTPAVVSIAVRGKVIATMNYTFVAYDENVTIPFTLSDVEQ